MVKCVEQRSIDSFGDISLIPDEPLLWVCQASITYCHLAGAGSDALLGDGEFEFDNRWVCRPVWSPFALVFGVL